MLAFVSVFVSNIIVFVLTNFFYVTFEDFIRLLRAQTTSRRWQEH